MILDDEQCLLCHGEQTPGISGSLNNAIPLASQMIPSEYHEGGKKDVQTRKTRLFTSSGSPECIKGKIFLKREYGPLLSD